eukprot:332761-Rhodomonas_salina.4
MEPSPSANSTLDTLPQSRAARRQIASKTRWGAYLRRPRQALSSAERQRLLDRMPEVSTAHRLAASPMLVPQRSDCMPRSVPKIA